MSDSNDPVEQFLKLLENPRVQAFFDNLVNTAVEKKIKESYETPEFKTAVDSMLITSELKPIKRIFELEKITGIYEFEEFEEHEPTLPEQIKRIEPPLDMPTVSIKIDIPVIPETTLERKACALVDHLKENVKPRNNEVFLNSGEIITVLKNEIPEDLRLKDIKNPRQAKKDILEKAYKLFSNSVQIIRNKSGNKVTGIALKPSVWRTDTYSC
jgi:hypothetical protein